VKYAAIAIGGAIGTLLRYVVSGFTHRFADATFPWGTLAVNLTGCFIIGFLWEVFDKGAFSPTIRLLVFVGFLGGYTTFSSFGLETFTLMRDGEYRLALVNILASNILGILLVFAGFFSARNLMLFLKKGV
jgi:CrcB protein